MSETFAQYGKAFQEKIMQALLTDHRWAEQLLEVFNPEYFELKYLHFLSERYFGYAKKYKVFPTLPLLVTIIKDELKLKVGSDEVLCNQIIDYLKRTQLNADLNDLPFVKEKSLDFCRKQALKAALEKAVDQMQAEKYESIADDIKRAVMVGTTPSIGHNFFEDYEARFTKLQRNAIPTGLPEIDRKEILNGGLGEGELGVIVAATGVGKSHFLTAMGCSALLQKKNVVHYTLEMLEPAVGIRYDSNLTNTDSLDVIDSKDKILEQYKTIPMGSLIIKHYPPRTASIYTLRAHLERLALKGFRPDLIIVDYADLLRSSRQYDSLRHELQLVYEELRAFAIEMGTPVWTASQSNKEGSNNEVIDLGNMSEAYGKAMTADVVLSISRLSHEKALGVGRLFVAKNRAGRDGIVYPINIDTARSKFIINGEQQLPEDAKAEDENSMKQRLRSKWQELKKDNGLSLTDTNASNRPKNVDPTVS
jgi:replicative DNA helicase